MSTNDSSRARRPLLPALAITLAMAFAAAPAHAVSITIANTDGPGEGLNDPSPRSPIDGNPGTTLGEQRKFALQYAADAWGLRLQGDVPILVAVSFDHLGGTAGSASLGGGRPTTEHKNFLHTPIADTWFVAALANQFYGDDLNDLAPEGCPEDLIGGKCPDIVLQFNSDIDGAVVLGNIDYYYGYKAAGGSDLDFLSQALHEIAHGLGLFPFIDSSTGGLLLGFNDAYTNHLEDAGFSPKRLSDMTNAQRKSAIVDNGHVFWTGPAVKAATGSLTAGARGDGALRIYTPTSFLQGFSVSHVDTVATPDELMEPFRNLPPARDLSITRAMLTDIGWDTFDVPTCGDANDDGIVSTPDALIVLKVAVGTRNCPAYACNVNFAGGVTPADALLVLKRAVGQDVALTCPYL